REDARVTAGREERKTITNRERKQTIVRDFERAGIGQSTVDLDLAIRQRRARLSDFKHDHALQEGRGIQRDFTRMTGGLQNAPALHGDLAVNGSIAIDEGIAVNNDSIGKCVDPVTCEAKIG